MTVAQVRSLSSYNRWANTRLLQAAAALCVEERERDLRASFGSLQGTLIHILWGERGWLRFWQTGDFVPRPTPGEYPDFEHLQSAWGRHEDPYAAYLLRLTQTELDAARALDADTYTLGEFVQHSFNHSTFHRGQVTLMLRQLGHQPPSTDYHEFLAEWRAGTA